jgi:4-methyl-5(b-hydroxyethyl)-thiazole monophosphate biosynthesis
MAHVITILADGFEEIEAITYIDLLRRASIEVTLLGLDTLDIRGAHDITIKADRLLKDFEDSYDGIILPGGEPGTTNLLNSPLVIQIVQNAFSKQLLCAAICGAPQVLLKAGILNGFKATSYPSVREKFSGITYLETSVVRDKNVITSRAIGTAIPFALELITYLTNASLSDKIKNAIVY